MGADGRLPLFAVEGEVLGGEPGEEGRGLLWWEMGVPGGLSWKWKKTVNLRSISVT